MNFGVNPSSNVDLCREVWIVKVMKCRVMAHVQNSSNMVRMWHLVLHIESKVVQKLLWLGFDMVKTIWQIRPICTCAILYKHHYSSVLTALSTFLSIKSFPFSSSAVSVPGAWVSVASVSEASVVGASVSGEGSQSTLTQHMHLSLHCTAVVHSL